MINDSNIVIPSKKTIIIKCMRFLSKYLQKLPAIYISLLLLFVIVLIFVIINKSFLSVYNLKTIGNLTAILLTVGLGQGFVILTGGIDLSVGGIISLISVVYLLNLEIFGYGANSS